MRTRVWLWLLVFVVSGGLLATAGLARPVQTKGGTLRIARNSDIDYVDPALAYNPDSWQIEFATCAKLYNYPDRPGREGAVVVPEVAKGFPSVSKDGRTQTIELNRGYRFHTGRRITAASFVAAFNRDANPEMQSPAMLYLAEIVGANAVMAGKAQTISGIRALGTYRLEIRTTRRLSDLPARLTMPFFCPITPGTPIEPDGVDSPPGSGPYYVASRVRNRQVVLERNRFYRGRRPANVDRIVWTIGVGPEACRQAVERDEFDYCASRSPSEAYRETVARYGINKGRFFFNPTLETDYFAFNHDRPAFKGTGQIPLKQAINWAIDRPALARAAGYLGAKRTDQILPPAMARDAKIHPLAGVTEQSLARARTLLAKARFKPEKLVLYAPNMAYGPAWAQIFRFNLRRLGIDVEVKYFSLGTLFAKTGTRGEPFDVTWGGWVVDYADPVTFFGSLLNGANIKSSGNLNTAYFDRLRYNREIERIDRMVGEARDEAWADLDVKMMQDDPPWAPVANMAKLDFVSESFGCYVFQPVVGRLDLAAACKK